MRISTNWTDRMASNQNHNRGSRHVPADDPLYPGAVPDSVDQNARLCPKCGAAPANVHADDFDQCRRCRQCGFRWGFASNDVING